MHPRPLQNGLHLPCLFLKTRVIFDKLVALKQASSLSSPAVSQDGMGNLSRQTQTVMMKTFEASVLIQLSLLDSKPVAARGKIGGDRIFGSGAEVSAHGEALQERTVLAWVTYTSVAAPMLALRFQMEPGNG